MRVGQFELVAQIGKGAFGQVFLAKLADGLAVLPGQTEQHYALKRLRPELEQQPGNREALALEVAVGMRLRHEHIVTTHPPLVDSAGGHWVVMDFVDGVTLRGLIRLRGRMGEPIPPPVVCRVVADIAEGLAHAHAARDDQGKPLNVVHRDIKPANVILGRDGGARLMDFGLVKLVGRTHQTAVGVLKGTVGYMAPEQVMGSDISPATDIYAAGVVMWELLALKWMVREKETLEALSFIAHGGGLKRIEELPPEVPPGLKAILRRALDPNPTARYRDAGEMARALRGEIDDTARGQVVELVKRHYPRLRARRKPIEASDLAALANTQAAGATGGWNTSSSRGVISDTAAPQTNPAPLKEGALPMFDPVTVGGVSAVPPPSESEITDLVSSGPRTSSADRTAIAPPPATERAMPAQAAAPPRPPSRSWRAPLIVNLVLLVVGLGLFFVAPNVWVGPADAELLLNGAAVAGSGSGAFRRLSVDEPAQLEVRAPGHWPEVVMLRPGGRVRVELRPQRSITIRSRPDGARLRIDGSEDSRLLPADIDGIDDGRSHLLHAFDEAGRSATVLFDATGDIPEELVLELR